MSEAESDECLLCGSFSDLQSTGGAAPGCVAFIYAGFGSAVSGWSSSAPTGICIVTEAPKSGERR